MMRNIHVPAKYDPSNTKPSGCSTTMRQRERSRVPRQSAGVERKRAWREAAPRAGSRCNRAWRSEAYLREVAGGVGPEVRQRRWQGTALYTRAPRAEMDVVVRDDNRLRDGDGTEARQQRGLLESCVLPRPFMPDQRACEASAEVDQH